METLIAILFCIALQRFANAGGWFERSWFDSYLKRMHPWIIKFNEFIGLGIIIVPIIMVLIVLNLVFWLRLFSLLGLILTVVVLFLSLDARDFKYRLRSYFASLKKGDVVAACEEVKGLNGENSLCEIHNDSGLCRMVTQIILRRSFAQIFPVLFWFVVFGDYGVYATAFYFALFLTQERILAIDADCQEIKKIAGDLKNAMDWIPSRLVGFSYAFVGNFNKGFSYCRKNFIKGINEVDDFVVGAGLASLDVDNADLAENYAALNIVNRVLIVWLSVIILLIVSSIL